MLLWIALPELYKNLKARKGLADNKLSSSTLFIDKEDVFCINGRLRHSEYQKHTIIIPQKHVTDLILRHCHETYNPDVQSNFIHDQD